MKTFFEFVKVRDVKSPSRGTEKSAGIDLFIPNKNEEFITILLEKNKKNIKIKNDTIILKPCKDILIPTGIYYKIPKNTMLMAANKSGVATKYKLIYGAEIGDEDYQGELHAHLINTSLFNKKLTFGQKIIQFIIVPVLYSEVIEKESLEVLYSNHESKRGSGGFGSTGS